MYYVSGSENQKSDNLSEWKTFSLFSSFCYAKEPYVSKINIVKACTNSFIFMHDVTYMILDTYIYQKPLYVRHCQHVEIKVFIENRIYLFRYYKIHSTSNVMKYCMNK